MRILLAGPDHEENLSIRYLSAALQAAGHDTVLAAFNSPVDASAVANAAESAGLIGLSMCFQARGGEFLALARRIKSRDPGKIVVAGGHYASCAAEALLLHHPELDIVVIHEGERTIVEIAGAMADLRGRLAGIPGIAYRDGEQVRFTPARPMLEDLDGLPCPDRSGPVYWIAGVPTSYLMGSRGCYGNCAYCCITTLHRLAPGKQFRQRNVEKIADEMAVLYRERGTRQFIFHDDNFLVPSAAFNRARITAFEEALRERGIREIALAIKCRPGDATPDVLRQLRDLGLIRVFLGVESATPRGLHALERDQSIEQSERALEACSGLGISAQFTLLAFHPDATVETLRSDIAFMRRFRANPLNFGRAEIYAGTPLEARMIACGRAEGDYRAREYRMTDRAADLACEISLHVFHSRCWSGGSLMQTAIGLDHAAAVVRRFFRDAQAEALARRVETWVRAANLDTIELLHEVVERSASARGRGDAGFERSIRDLSRREAASRDRLLTEAKQLTIALQRLHSAKSERRTAVAWPRLARPAAAALLAVGIPASPVDVAAQQTQARPPISSAAAEKGACSIAGRVIDPSGAVIPHAKITITNAATKAAHKTNTDDTGQYVVKDLPPGQYSIEAFSAGFRTTRREGIAVKAGACEMIDVGLTLEVGSCEYVAVETNVANHEVDWLHKRKPFTYVVGQGKDNGTLQGIAKLVYGDSGAWLPIFEANRTLLPKPGPVPYGSAIFIPPQKRLVPKLVFKVAPVYPPSARTNRISGDVLLDVTLNDDGSVRQTATIEGDPVLAEAATAAVRQWRYRPLIVRGKPVRQFIVLLSFGKNGKVPVGK